MEYPGTKLIREVYNGKSSNVFSINVTGGGVQALSWLFSVPGSSRSVVDGKVPYSRESLRSVLDSIGAEDCTGSCSSETAVFMAKYGYTSALTHLLLSGLPSRAIVGSNVFGVSCTAALVSELPKKGAHRCHIAVYSRQRVVTYSIELEKSKLRSRTEEDALCSQLVIDAICKQCGVALPATSLLLASETEHGVEKVVSTNSGHVDLLEEVRAGKRSHVVYFPTSVLLNSSGASFDDRMIPFESIVPAGSVVFPGSFNPLHQGHVELVRSYLRHSGSSSSGLMPLVVFEIAVVNADKPPLSREEVERRVVQFYDLQETMLAGLRFAVCVTSQPLFVGKSTVFKNCQFVVGADTCSRLIESRYYADRPPLEGGDAATRNLLNMVAALTTIKLNGCKFVVGGRVKVNKDGKRVFETLNEILRESSCGAALPLSVADMFEALDESEFRVDLSSTEIRASGILNRYGGPSPSPPLEEFQFQAHSYIAPELTPPVMVLNWQAEGDYEGLYLHVKLNSPQPERDEIFALIGIKLISTNQNLWVEFKALKSIVSENLEKGKTSSGVNKADSKGKNLGKRAIANAISFSTTHYTNEDELSIHKIKNFSLEVVMGMLEKIQRLLESENGELETEILRLSTDLCEAETVFTFSDAKESSSSSNKSGLSVARKSAVVLEPPSHNNQSNSESGSSASSPRGGNTARNGRFRSRLNSVRDELFFLDDF